jgi:16S rRNA (cytidine1402-2'-O)-methyltransferase
MIFAENERTARRFLKAMDSSIQIDDFEWHAIHKAEAEQLEALQNSITQNKNIAIISEAGCPGIADPGQILIAAAQELKCDIRPLVGPSSILLALMASGMNGQHFEFLGYLPIDNGERIKAIRQMEADSSKKSSTCIFIETPYRNNALLEALLQHCKPNTKICIGIDITGEKESIVTRTVADWKKNKPELHKIPVIFLLQA